MSGNAYAISNLSLVSMFLMLALGNFYMSKKHNMKLLFASGVLSLTEFVTSILKNAILNLLSGVQNVKIIIKLVGIL